MDSHAQFDPAPAARVLSIKVVADRLGCSRTTLWREIKAKRFVRPLRISPGRVGFLESDVNAFLAERAQDRAAAA